MGFLVRIGNFINSEIVGTPTTSPYGVLFAKDVVEQLQQGSEAIESVNIEKEGIGIDSQQNYQPIRLATTFKNFGF